MKRSWFFLVIAIFFLSACTRGPIGKLGSLYWYQDYGIPSKSSLQETQYIPNLVKALKDDNPRVGIYAAKALRDMGPAAESSLPGLADIAKGDFHIKVRLHAIEALTAISKDNSITVETLSILMLSGQPGKIREAAGKWMTTLGPSAASAIPSLIQALDSTYPKVRNYAAMTLAYIGPNAKEALPALEKVAEQDSRNAVKDSAKEAIRRITYASSVPGSDQVN